MAAPVVSNKGTKNEKAAAGSGTPTSVIGFTTDGGKALLVSVAIRRGGTLSIGTPTLTDSFGNTYTYVGKAENATGVAGAVAMLFYCNRARGLYTGAWTMTLTTASAFTAISIRVMELDVPAVAVTSPSLAAAVGASGTAIAVTSGTPPNTNDRLWVGVHADLNANTGLDTISSTGYTLSPTSTTMEGTSGSTAESNVVTKLGYKGVTGSSTTQNFNGTLSASHPWVALIAAFETTTSIDVTSTVLDIVPPATIRDSFTRADVNPDTGYPASGMAGNITTAAKVKSNQMMGTVAGGWAVYDSALGNVQDDQYAYITPTVLDAGPGGHAWIDMRITGEGSTSTVDGYEVELHRGNTPDDIIIWRTVNGAAVAKAKIAYPWTAGWSLGGIVLGSTVYALVNKNAGAGWQVVLSWTDPSPLAPGSSKIGFGGNLDNATTPTGGIVDDWAAGALTRGSKSVVFDIAPTGTTNNSVNLTSTYTISPTGVREPVGAVSLTSTYTIAAAGEVYSSDVLSGQIGPLTATFTIAPTGTYDAFGAAAITSTFLVSPTGTREPVGAAAITSTYTISPTGIREPVGVVSLTSTYTISPTGTREPVGAAAMTSAYTIAPTGVREPVGAAAITSTYTISASGEVTSDVLGSTSIAAQFAINATGNNEGVSAASITTAFTLSPTGTREARGTVSLTSTYTLSPAGHREALGRVDLHETFTLAPTGRREALGAAIVTSTYTIAPTGGLDVFGAAAMSFTIDIGASGEEFAPTQYGAASIVMTFAMTPTGTYERVSQEVLAERLLVLPFRAIVRAPRQGAAGPPSGRGGGRGFTSGTGGATR